MRISLLFLTAMVGAALGACDSSTSADNTQPCDAGRCPAGFVCELDFCVPDSGTSTDPNRLGSAGGTVTGPDGVTLTVPATALSNGVTFAIARMSTTANVGGVLTASRVYQITPAGTSFAAAATVTLPVASGDIPAGYTAGDVALWKSTSIDGTYTKLTAASASPGFVAGTTTSLSFFVAGVDAELPPTTTPPPGGTDFTGGSLGDAFLRDCNQSPTVCDPTEPTCFQAPSGARVCTGTCQFDSDCPQGSCCWDTLQDNNPATTLCVPTNDCGVDDTAIPAHRSCTVDGDCPRGGACVSGQCYSQGGNGDAIAGAACSSPSDCNLSVTDHCLHRLDDDNVPATTPSSWRTGTAGDNAGADNSVCAQECDSNGQCPAGQCCRLAWLESSIAKGYCFDSTGAQGSANCVSVTPLYGACDWTNPSTCDPTQTDQCVRFELATGEGSYCSKRCDPGGSVTDQCGANTSCCALDSYRGDTYCINAANACP